MFQTEVKPGVRTSGLNGFAVMPIIRRAQRESLKKKKTADQGQDSLTDFTQPPHERPVQIQKHHLT